MPHPRSSDQLLTTLIPLAYRGVPLAVLTNFIVSTLVVFVLWGHIANQTLAYWLIGVFIVSSSRLGLWMRFQTTAIEVANVRRWANGLTLISGANGLMWCLAGFFLFVPDNPYLQTFLLFVIGGMATGALAVSGQYMPAFQAFFLLSLPAIGIRLFLTGEPVEKTMAAMVAVYSVVIFFAGLRVGESFINVLTLQQRIRAIMDNVFDGIVTIDAQGRIKSENPVIENMFGYTAKETIGKSFFGDCIPAEYNIDASSQLPVSGDSWKWGTATSARELVAKRKDGSTFLADVATSNVTYGGEEIHIATVRDITEQKAIQIQLLQTSKLATLGQMAAGIAHELNQPLNVIRMAAENALIRRKERTLDPDFTEEKLERIAQQSEKMGDIINHLRMFSRIDKERVELFDLEAAVNQSIELVRDQFDIDNIQMRTQLPDGPLMAKGHPNQLEHVLLNLLSNARDAIKERRKHDPKAPRTREVDVEVRTNGSEAPITVRVSDNGMGIASKDLDQIFDPFFTTKMVGEGTGLGLSIAQSIIGAMGGQLSAMNIANGACFEIKLPQAPGSESA